MEEKIIFIASTVIVGTIIFAGFSLGMGLHNHLDDVDCQFTTNQYDESEREINGCKKYCVEEPMWFIWGTHQDCYWDDE